MWIYTSTPQHRNNFTFYITTLHVSAIIKCVEVWGNCCVVLATAIRVSIFYNILNVVNVDPPPMPHVLVLGGGGGVYVVYQVCSVKLCTAQLIHNMRTKGKRYMWHRRRNRTMDNVQKHNICY
jgi:hypothetical protein